MGSCDDLGLMMNLSLDLFVQPGHVIRCLFMCVCQKMSKTAIPIDWVMYMSSGPGVCVSGVSSQSSDWMQGCKSVSWCDVGGGVDFFFLLEVGGGGEKNEGLMTLWR